MMMIAFSAVPGSATGQAQRRGVGRLGLAGLVGFVGAALCLTIALVSQGLVASVAEAASQPVAKGTRLTGDAKRTRFVVDLSKPVEFNVFALADPYRVVIDLPDIDFQLPGRPGEKGLGLVSAYRYGLFAPGKSRIVIDMKAPFFIERAQLQKTQANGHGELVIDLVPTDRETFFKLRAERQLQLAEAALKEPGAIPAPALVIEPPDPAKRLIVIDPGHGGVDSGAHGSRAREKDIVLAFSKILRDRLNERGKYTVKMTRETDIFIPLGGRVEFARKHQADLFVSIHADSVDGRAAARATGATIYTLSERASDEEARRAAAKENMSDTLAGVEDQKETDSVVNMLADLRQRESMYLSHAFAASLIPNLRKATAMRPVPQRSAGFRVLKNPEVPAILVELGYMTHRGDEANMLSEDWRKRVSTSLADAIDQFFSKEIEVAPFGQ